MRNCDPSRIFSRVLKTDSGCWLYTGGLQSGGYGVVSIKNRSVYAHCLAYRLRVGAIPKGLCVLHKCDVRRCINPKHLFLGTRGENNTDRETKGRSDDRRGERNTQVKLDAKRIARIRRIYRTGKFSQREVGEMFDISQQHVSLIVRGEAWKHTV